MPFAVELLQERIKWASENVFGSKSNACALAYSQIQVPSSLGT